MHYVESQDNLFLCTFVPLELSEPFGFLTWYKSPSCFRFPVISLSSTTCHVSGEARLIVGDSQDGVLLYAFKPGVRKLELLFADKERRTLADAAAVSDDGLSAFGADSGGGVAVMSADRRPVKSTSPEFNLDVMAW